MPSDAAAGDHLVSAKLRDLRSMFGRCFQDPHRILKAGAPGVRNVVVGANGQTAETAAHLKTPPAIRRV